MRSHGPAPENAAIAALEALARRQECLLADLAAGRPADLDGVARDTAAAADCARDSRGEPRVRAALERAARLNAAIAEAIGLERRRVGESIASIARARRIGSNLKASPAPFHDRTA